MTKMKGINLKELSQLSKIPYSTVLYLSKNTFEHWNEDHIDKLSKSLNMDTEDFVKQLTKPLLSPFIKWVGGKRQLLPYLIKYAPKQFNTYYEPFIGGGALLFKLEPKNAVINDFNEELVNTWNVLKNDLNNLNAQLSIHEQNDSKDYYMNIRSVDRDGRILNMNDVERAGRFIYLNKAGYNGLWRVNQKGQNNVPYGDHKKLNLRPDCMFTDSEYLNKNNIKIMNGDYKECLKNVKKGDFIYLDPPYIPLNPTSNFTSYTKNNFGLIQQKELSKIAEDLNSIGVKVMLSNADVPLIDELYKNSIFNVHHVQANRVLNSSAKKRGKVGEVIITNY
ncbi:Dam family site-specific DNA-(adenine-N6)-methyltransferase [Apilactobacillus timberlakei]|uniref:Dam family site-specific DNA-(adenine-N6)-methyltransferase n=1 Tax=Apilactobacillus timberlakei TaxID=2008380 RepID=UPI001CDCB813|nr:Dam family site-specific DNA-(adenine-N6)-methyltransferase [Apilactobacillus timberlakei]